MLLELLINRKIRSETSFEVQNITYTSPTGDGANVSDGSKLYSYQYLFPTLSCQASEGDANI